MTEYGAAELNLGITEKLADYLANLKYEDLPGGVAHECRRGVLDWLGCALAGSQHATIDRLTRVLQTINSTSAITAFGCRMKLGMLEGPLANGQMGHVLDYDDTNMDGVLLHTSGPVLASLLALGESRSLNGKDLMVAYVAAVSYTHLT